MKILIFFWNFWNIFKNFDFFWNFRNFEIFCNFRNFEILNFKFIFFQFKNFKIFWKFWNFMKFVNTDKLTNFHFVCWGTGASKFSNIASIYVKIETRNLVSSLQRKYIKYSVYDVTDLTNEIVRKPHHMWYW
jgi:hypothetical protein